MQDSKQKLIPDRHNAVNFRGREGCVEEESYFDVHIGTNFLSQHGGHKEKMKVMDPDEVSILHVSSNGLGKYAVGSLVCRPGLLAEVHLTWVIVKDRP